MLERRNAPRSSRGEGRRGGGVSFARDGFSCADPGHGRQAAARARHTSEPPIAQTWVHTHADTDTQNRKRQTQQRAPSREPRMELRRREKSAKGARDEERQREEKEGELKKAPGEQQQCESTRSRTKELAERSVTRQTWSTRCTVWSRTKRTPRDRTRASPTLGSRPCT